MGGRNPYIRETGATLPGQAYTLTVEVEETGEVRAIEVDPAALPYGHDGLPGSVLDIVLGAGVEIDHACGGVCACSTCHVFIEAGLESCSRSTDDEEDMLDTAPGLQDDSRLGCQCVPDGSMPVRVKVPAWNRNLAQEDH